MSEEPLGLDADEIDALLHDLTSPLQTYDTVSELAKDHMEVAAKLISEYRTRLAAAESERDTARAEAARLRELCVDMLDSMHSDWRPDFVREAKAMLAATPEPAPEPPARQCWMCHGSGRVAARIGDMRCSQCGGTGLEPAPLPRDGEQEEV